LRRGRRKRARLDGQLPEAAVAWTFPCAQPGMISNLLFINQKGDVVISRTYREGASQKVIDMFRHQVIAGKEAGRSPVKIIDGTAFMFIKHGNMYAVAVSSGNAQAALAFQFLHDVVKVLTSYFGDFTEDSVRNNFVLIYELLDEVIDYGYPQNCSVEVLKMYITQEGNRRAVQERAGSSGVTIQATGAISWRKEGIKYRKNELFIDVIEECNLMMSSKGTVLRNDVEGKIMVKCYLSGQPECKFGLNDKLLLESEAKTKKSAVRRPGSGIEIDDVSFNQVGVPFSGRATAPRACPRYWLPPAPDLRRLIAPGVCPMLIHPRAYPQLASSCAWRTPLPLQRYTPPHPTPHSASSSASSTWTAPSPSSRPTASSSSCRIGSLTTSTCPSACCRSSRS